VASETTPWSPGTVSLAVRRFKSDVTPHPPPYCRLVVPTPPLVPYHSTTYPPTPSPGPHGHPFQAPVTFVSTDLRPTHHTTPTIRRLNFCDSAGAPSSPPPPAHLPVYLSQQPTLLGRRLSSQVPYLVLPAPQPP